MKAIALIAVGAAVASLAAGCSRPNESERYLNQVSVDGYRKAGEGYETAPLAYFVGEAREDVLTAVRGPGDLLVAKDDVDLSLPSMHDLGSGEGVLDGQVRCRVLVFRQMPNGSAPPYLGKGGGLTEKEAAGFADGTVYVLRISALCDPQTDRAP